MKNSFAIIFVIISLFASSLKSEAQVLSEPQPEIINMPDSRVYYSVFVQSFYDSNNDGIGDIKGLISKLDYIKDLGAGGIWLLPVHPSPSYHKYDISDYYGIHPDYGTLQDYKDLVEEAHKRDLNVLLDLVVNHTSNRHPWFEKAAKDPKSKYRDYFIWSDSQEEFDKEPYHWHQVRDDEGNKLEGERYYGFFWWEMPDWNFDNKAVRKEFGKIGKFWLDEIGVDGFRLDAIKYVYPENRLKDNLEWWSDFRKSLGKENQSDFIVAEIWGGSDEVAPYLSNGISAGFNFELADTIVKSLKDGINYNIAETAQKIKERFLAENAEAEDAIFLTNHDMDRIMTQVEGNELKAKIGATLLFTLPGNPFIYYGEEIGMKGEKPDEFIREPFLWNIEGEDSGQTSWEIPFSSTSNTVKPLEFQKNTERSLYNTYKELIHLRNENTALNKGAFSVLNTNNKSIVAYFRFSQTETILVFINLGDSMQRISAIPDIQSFETIYGTHPVFKGGPKGIALQPESAFILKRKN